MKPAHKNSRFQRGSGAYKCGSCGKTTRETGQGESSVELCAQCYFEGGQENLHTDNHIGRMADCLACQQAFKTEGYELGTDDRWCDSEMPGTIWTCACGQTNAEWHEYCNNCQQPFAAQPAKLSSEEVQTCGICHEEVTSDQPHDHDHAYERDDRGPEYWRTNQTDLIVELSQHDRNCRCPQCEGDPA